MTSLPHQDYTVGWICALPTEMAAAQCMLDERHSPPPQESHDHNMYTFGRIGAHNVVLACLPAGVTGTIPAARVATQMLSSFKLLRFGLMVGIGGGVPSEENDIRLGDVVISQPTGAFGGVIKYDFRKTVQEGKFTRTGALNKPPGVLLTALASLQSKHIRQSHELSKYISEMTKRYPRMGTQIACPGPQHDSLYDAQYDHPSGVTTCSRCDVNRLVAREPRPSEEPVIHYGLIASGDQVMRHGYTRDKLRREINVLCFEMEAAGLMDSFPCVVIRGICDYADSHKNKRWEPYAAATAAACAKELLYTIPKEQVLVTYLATKTTKIAQEIESAIDRLNLDELPQILSAVDQEQHKSTIPSLSYNQPNFYWILKNADLEDWSSDTCSQVLWLSGPPICNIDQVSSYVIDVEKKKASETQHSVLYFFCSTADTETPIVSFTHSLLYQILCCSSSNEKAQIVKTFLHSLRDAILGREETSNAKPPEFKEGDSPSTIIKKVLDAETNGLWSALRVALDSAHSGDLSIVIDGLDQVKRQKVEFIREVRELVKHLQGRISKVKALLTSQAEAEIKEVLDGLPCIEYDKERKECLASLYFDNTRYSKISKGHEGTFEWLWTHEQYKEWSASGVSRPLYVQGKPGSGKSTLTKYFKDNLLEREPNAKSAIIADFFYSYREGERQTSHHNMLQSILYDILDQKESFFYHFQSKYRNHRKSSQGVLVEWTYDSLKDILSSLGDHQQMEQLYLVIDAMDESNDEDRRDILKRLFDLCSRSKCCVFKIFVASRPVPELDHRISNIHHSSIKLQDQTEPEIKKFACSFLGPDLGFTDDLLHKATTYIVDHAQGVFLWVVLVRKELLPFAEGGYRKREIFEQLKKLPTELQDYYEHILRKIEQGSLRDIRDGTRMFQLAFFARRSLTVAEFQHALAIEDDPNAEFGPSDDESFENELIEGIDKRIIQCGGNFLEIKENVSVQVMHQTVREFFLRPGGYVARSKLRMSETDAHVGISLTCIRYLVLCATSANKLPNVRSWTPEHFERYAQYLNERPLTNYALGHLKHHIDSCCHVDNLLHIVSLFVEKLTNNPAAYLLESWVTSHLKKTLRNRELCKAAEDFRNKVLHAAARKRFPRAAEVLLLAGAQVEAPLQGKTPLIVSAEMGDNTTVLLLLEHQANVEAETHDGRTALHWAAEKGHKAAVQMLLEHGADVGVKDKGGETALHWAAQGGHDATMRVLLEHQADVEAKTRDRRTALHWAAEKGHKAAVQMLLEHGADVNARIWGRGTALHRAAENGHEAAVRVLLEHEADVNAKIKGGETALHRAAENGHEAAVRVLLEYWADVKAKIKGGETALHRAAEKGHEAAVRVLLEHLADIDAEDKGGETALHRAAENWHEAVVRVLLEHRAGVDAKDKGGETALHRAAGKGHEAAVRVLLKHGADVDAKDKGGETALHRAAGNGHEAAVRVLLKHGADVDVKDKGGETALHWAAGKRHETAMRVLLERRADINAKDKNGETALHRAAGKGHETAVRVLLEHRADINAKDKNGETALHRAAGKGHETAVRVLLEHRADVDAKAEYKGTALHWAAGKGHEAAMRVLLEYRADVDAKAKGGETALHRAAGKGHEAVVRVLLKHRVDVDAKDKAGETALDWAAEKGHEAAVRVLLEHRADVDAKAEKGHEAVEWVLEHRRASTRRRRRCYTRWPETSTA